MKEDDDDTDSSADSSYSGLESEPDTSGSSDLEEHSDVEEIVSQLLCVLHVEVVVYWWKFNFGWCFVSVIIIITLVTRTVLMSYTPESLGATGPQRLLGVPYFFEILSHLSLLKAESIM